MLDLIPLFQFNWVILAISDTPFEIRISAPGTASFVCHMRKVPVIAETLMTWLRDIDRWLIASVLPGKTRYIALATRLVGSADAEDLVQEAYAKLFAVSNWREISNPVAFTLQIVRNLALDRLRRASLVQIENVAALDLAGIIDDVPTPDAVAAARSELARVRAMIDDLPPQCRTVVRMRKFEGLSPRQIAVSLGLSVSTVEKHLAKGLATITRDLARDLATVEEGDRPQAWTKRSPRA